MKPRRRSALPAVLLALSSFCLSFSAHAASAGAPGRICHLPGHDEPLRCVGIAVPFDYAKPAGDKLDLHVTIAPAFRQPARPDPVFVLAGGPGQAGSDVLMLLDNTFRRLRATRDIVFIDQRGTGLSGKLDCENTKEVDELSPEEQDKAVADCIASLHKPFAAYTTGNAARDIDRVRAALGYAQVNLWGASYGTRLAQVYARRFPASVRALILDGVASPEQIIVALGADTQASLEAVFRQCDKDRACRSAFPELRSRFRALLEQIEAGQVKLDLAHPRTTARMHMVLRPSMFQQTLRMALYSPATRNRIPFLIDSADKGNWAPFAAQMYAMSDVAMSPISLGLYLSVVCAEDVPRVTPEVAAEEARNSFLAGQELKTIPKWCRYVNVPPISADPPAAIEAPALLLAGALDPVTPPHRAEEAKKHMTHAQLLVVRNGGHIVSPLGCAPRLLREFLDKPGQAVDGKCLDDIPPVGFQLGPSGPRP